MYLCVCGGVFVCEQKRKSHWLAENPSALKKNWRFDATCFARGCEHSLTAIGLLNGPLWIRFYSLVLTPV